MAVGEVVALRQTKRDPDAPMLVCITCQKEKPREDFYRLHKGSEARQSRCKVCDNEVRMHGVRRHEGAREPQGPVFKNVVRREPIEGVLEEPEERDEELERARAARRDVLEAARFGSIAGHLMMVHRLPLRLALERASEYVEEFPGELPEGCELVLPKKPPTSPWFLGGSGGLSTPPERRTEPPKSVDHLIPRERGGEPDLLDERVRMGGFDEEEPAAAPEPRAARAPRKMTPTTTVGSKDTKTMSGTPIREAVWGALETPKGVAEIAEAIGREVKDVGSCLGRMRGQGLVTKEKGYGMPWSRVAGATLPAEGEEQPAKAKRKPKTIADVAKKAARKEGKRAKANGKGNGHATMNFVSVQAEGSNGAVKAALDALAAALTQDFNAKMAAIKTLGG